MLKKYVKLIINIKIMLNKICNDAYAKKYKIYAITHVVFSTIIIYKTQNYNRYNSSFLSIHSQSSYVKNMELTFDCRNQMQRPRDTFEALIAT